MLILPKSVRSKKYVYSFVCLFIMACCIIYSVNITSIKNLGPGTPDTKPDPDEYKAYLDVEFGVYPWIVRDQDADLE